jgi:hypothetical protein
MTGRRLGTLAGITLLIVAGALWLSSERRLRHTETAGERVLPALSAALNEVTEVRLIKAGEKPVVTLRRGEKSWGLVERAQYPADDGKLRKLLIDLSELKVVEQKTSDPANYAVLGVEDVKSPDASGVRIELSGLKQPLALILGKSAGSRSSYARVADAAASIVVTPAITLDTEPRNWLNRSLIDIEAGSVQQVRVTPADGAPYTALREVRDQTDLIVPDLPKGRELASPTAANPLAAALSGLSLDDVRAAPAEEQWSADSPRAEFRLFDGTMIEVVGREDGDQNWVRLAVRFDEAQQKRFAAVAPAEPKPDATTAAAAAAHADKPEETRAQVAALAARFNGWTFAIPAYQYDALFRPLKDLLKSA